jgi:hypothetical protein
MPTSVRSLASPVLAVLAGMLLTLGASAWYVRSEIVDERAFAERASASLDDEDVRKVVADRIVDALVEQGSPDVLAVRPLLTSAIEALAATEPFRRLFEFAVRDAHGVLVGEQDTSVIVDLGRAGALLAEGLRSVSPEVARAVPPDLEPRLADIEADEFEADGARTIADVARLAPLWLVLALACAAGSLAIAPRRRVALAEVAASAAAAGALIALVVALGGELAADQAVQATPLDDPDRVHGAVAAVWDALLGDLRRAAMVLAALAASISAVAAGTVRPEQAEELWRRIVDVARSRRPAVRALRGVVAAFVGFAAVLAPGPTARAVIVAAGALLAFVGIADVARALERRAANRRRGTPVPAQLVAAGLCVALVAAAGVSLAAVLDRPGEAPALATPTGGCNGSRALCERRLNEVVIPATHNSFSAAERPGWLFANQRHGIARQLDDGIRGLLLDVHYGVRDPESGRVRTDVRAEGIDRNRVARELSPEALETADRLAGGVGLGRLAGPRRPYLCHTLCELGAEPFVTELIAVRRFLERHRGDVVVLFLEPYAPPDEIERSLRGAGLLRYAAALRRDRPLPTLGELVASGRRLVVFSESQGGARPWYLPGFSFVQDTPLGAREPHELSCARFRGDGDSPLLLVNHWIDRFPPPPSANARIGRRAFLRARLRRCARERGLLPNLVAVDFYDMGAVVEVARELNALPRGALLERRRRSDASRGRAAHRRRRSG